MVNSVYITRLSKFFPNDPVSNDEMEGVLGMVNDKPSKARAIVLRNNGIKKRYYAYRDGKATHTNAEIAAEAIKGLFDEKVPISKMEVLAVGTTSPEQILPSHGVMTHGQLGIHRVEVMSGTGACCSSMQALKYAYMSVASGMSKVAVACGSERFSAYTNATRFKPEMEKLSELQDNPIIAFEKDFLRWMLSDGAGAALLQPEPNKDGLSLKIEWLDLTSWANELETCMYAGNVKNEDKSTTGWNDMTPDQWIADSVFALKQDTRLLGENIVPRGGDYLAELMAKHNLTADDVDWYMPHMSSEFFKGQIFEGHKKIGMEIPYEKWFYNLPWVGNVGSASPFLMMEEAMSKGMLKKGDRILMMVPESARFTYAYMYMTVV
ncbi:MAG: StlD/DarB family beta-ketosynthase [Sphingobacteriales bacterium]|nr:MAG: StlD/DarB family beta-ketosynthase [Sphingobacteriales bacterium]